jgi:hypothetical protein
MLNPKINVQSKVNPYSDFFIEFINECVLLAPENSKFYYIWCEPLENLKEILANLDYNAPNVFLFIPDSLYLYDFNPAIDHQIWGVKIISQIVNSNPDTKFILVSDVINLAAEFDNIKNLEVIQTEYITKESLQYPTLAPVINKNFNSNKSFIALNNRPAVHRILSVSYMLTHDLDHFGVITLGPQFAKIRPNLLDMVSWDFTEENKKLFEPGFARIKSQTFNTDYRTINFVQHKNFDTFLRPLYQDSFVEIVAETCYAEPSFMLTEKILNPIYGCNFPIILSSVGIVSHLEQLGFDMFRDVIDHSYDQIKDPFDRLVRAFKDNHQILTDVEYAKSQWRAHKDRLLNNVEFAKDKLYQVIYQKSKAQFDQIQLVAAPAINL